MMLYRITFLLLLTLLYTSCAKDIDIFIPDEVVEDPDSGRIISNLSGIVLDQTSEPVSNALLQYGDQITQTDENGVFRISDAEVRPERAIVRLEAEGYFPAEVVVLPREDAEQFLRIRMEARIQTASFQSDVVSTVEPETGFIFSIDANSLENDLEELYSGSVSVFTSTYDPTDLADFRQIPGDLAATDLTGESVTLEPFVGFRVHLEDPVGNHLGLREGKSLVPRITIPGNLQAVAPSLLPVWKFNETAGLWMEAGMAIRDGNEYECDISESGIWMLAAAHPWLEIEGICRDDADRPVCHTVICLQFNPGNFSALGFTDGNGAYRLRIPKGMAQDLHLLDDCANELYTTLLGSLSGNTMVPPIILDNGIGFATWLSGSVRECGLSPLTDGYVLLMQDNWTRPVLPDPDGTFGVHVADCTGSPFRLKAVSLSDPTVQSLEIPHPYYPEMTLGILNACSDLPTSFCYYQMDEEAIELAELSATPEAGQTFISDPGATFQLLIPGEEAGEYQLSPGSISLPGFNFDQILETDLTVLLDTFGGSGQSVTGSLSGSYLDTIGMTHTIFARFRAVVN